MSTEFDDEFLREVAREASKRVDDLFMQMTDRVVGLCYGPYGREHTTYVKPAQQYVQIPVTPGSKEMHYYRRIGDVCGKAIFVR